MNIVFEQKTKNDARLRPTTFDGFINQRHITEALKVAIAKAGQTHQVLDHILFTSPPGLGKTTLAEIVARELGASFQGFIGSQLKDHKALSFILRHNQGGVIFIDEIHALPPRCDEILYRALEDFVIPDAQGKYQTLQPFTFIGATTDPQRMLDPLRQRFPLSFHLDYYSSLDIQLIIECSAIRLETHLEPGVAEALARVTRGVPRLANRYLKRTIDFSADDNIVTPALVWKFLGVYQIDPHYGLDTLDIRFLQSLRLLGGTASIDVLASVLGERAAVLSVDREPYLIRLGFITRNSRGRNLTVKGEQALLKLRLWLDTIEGEDNNGVSTEN